jgi:transposase, IS5 family
MSEQGTLRFGMVRKILRVEKFLDTMEKVLPWSELEGALRPHYKDGSGGRPAHALLLMLKLYMLQQWYNLSDEGTEEAVYDRLSFQKFLGFDCFGGEIPDRVSLLRFRHMLEQHNLSGRILEVINAHLAQHGLVSQTGTIVDATLLQAPVSKKNARKERDPEMSSTRKNNKWYFGAKGHIGVQSEGKPIVHSTAFSTAKDHDKVHMTKLFHGKERAILISWRSAVRGMRACIMALQIALRASIHYRLLRSNAIVGFPGFVRRWSIHLE